MTWMSKTAWQTFPLIISPVPPHGVLSRIRNTQIQDGMHVFGKPPEGEKRVNYINAILRYDAG